MDIEKLFTKIYSTPFKTVYLKKDESICLSVWQETDQLMTDEEYKEDALQTLDIILSYSIRFVITDNRCIQFKYSDSLEAWYKEHFFGSLIKKSKIERLAIVAGENLRLSILLEELLEGVTFKIKSLSSIEESYEWVKRKLPKK